MMDIKVTEVGKYLYDVEIVEYDTLPQLTEALTLITVTAFSEYEAYTKAKALYEAEEIT